MENTSWSRGDAIAAMRRVVDDCIDKDGHITDKKTYVAAVSELNRLCGHYDEKEKAGAITDESIDGLLRALGYKK